MKNKTGFILLYSGLFVYSLSSIFLKLASMQDFLSFKYICFLCCVFLCLGIYAVLWQQVLKRMELSIAMTNRPLTLCFNSLWAWLFFGELITIKTMMGLLLIILGMVLVVVSNKEK